MIKQLPAVLLLAAHLSSALHAASYNTLMLYQGTWHVTRKSAGANAKPDELKNQCASLGKFFACQQTISGSVTALLIFIATNQPGHYITQNILPEGRAAGKGDLEISGSRWVFTSSWNQGSKTTQYRTTNTFVDRNHIRFEQEESSDGAHWEIKDSGDYVRISPK